MAKTYSRRYHSQLRQDIRDLSENAHVYIETITAVWTNSRWTGIPRYGICTSNTSESVNSMFDKARGLVWMDALETIVEIMFRRVIEKRTEYAKKHPEEILLPALRKFKQNYAGSADIQIPEHETEKGTFHCAYKNPAGHQPPEDPEQHRSVPLMRNFSHRVFPDDKACTCLEWQQTLNPCKHACAYFRFIKHHSEHQIMSSEVHKLYKAGIVQQMFQRYILPVSLDTLTYDCVTKPPFPSQRGVGRPKKHARIRSRSKFCPDEESNVTCSQCGKRDHNKRTCGRRQEQGTGRFFKHTQIVHL